LREIGNSRRSGVLSSAVFVRKRRIRNEIKRLSLHNIISSWFVYFYRHRAHSISLLFFLLTLFLLVSLNTDEYTSRQRWLVSSPGYENTVIESSSLLFFLIFSCRHFHYLCLCRDICHDYSVYTAVFFWNSLPSVERESEDLGCYMRCSW